MPTLEWAWEPTIIVLRWFLGVVVLDRSRFLPFWPGYCISTRRCNRVMFAKAIQLPFKLLGIPILLDWTFLIILPVMAWMIGGDLAGWARVLQLGDVSSISHGS